MIEKNNPFKLDFDSSFSRVNRNNRKTKNSGRPLSAHSRQTGLLHLNIFTKLQKSSDNVATKEKSSDIILNYLKENDSINNSTAREITGLTAPAVRKIFKKLEAEGLIVGTGENKNRTYSLKK